jgi:hypothetical protein
MLRFLAQLRDAYRAQGPRLVLVAGRWFVRPEYLMVVGELGQGRRAYDAHEEAHWTLLQEGNLPALLAMSPFLTEAEIRRLWAEGQECQTCWIDGAPVFYRWDTCGPAYLPYLDRTFLPRSGDQFVSQVFTHPAFRARGLLSASRAYVEPRMREQGARREVALVAWWNAPPLHVARGKYDFGVVGTVGYWRLGPWRRHFATGAVRLVGRKGIRVEERPDG